VLKLEERFLDELNSDSLTCLNTTIESTMKSFVARSPHKVFFYNKKLKKLYFLKKIKEKNTISIAVMLSSNTCKALLDFNSPDLRVI